jgi:hypothetical protein
LKKPTGSVRFLFFKHGTGKTEPNPKQKTGKKLSKTEPNRKNQKKTDPNRKKPSQTGLNRFLL